MATSDLLMINTQGPPKAPEEAQESLVPWAARRLHLPSWAFLEGSVQLLKPICLPTLSKWLSLDIINSNTQPSCR